MRRTRRKRRRMKRSREEEKSKFRNVEESNDLTDQ